MILEAGDTKYPVRTQFPVMCKVHEMLWVGSKPQQNKPRVLNTHSP